MESILISFQLKENMTALKVSPCMAVLLAILLVGATLVAAGGASGPDGTYCGSYSFGLVKGKAVFQASKQVFSIHLDAFGKDISCNDEHYSYDGASGVLTVPGAADGKDCLGQLLSDNGLSLSATYDASGNTASLDLGLASIDLASC